AVSRTASRLLHVAGAKLCDRAFADLPELLAPGDLLVFNDTKVIRSRLHGRKDSGGRVELLLERIVDDDEAWMQLSASHPPTAGLHFDEPMLERLRERGVAFAYVTLHVGAGTFQPVEVEDLALHRMHSERFDIPAATVAAVAAARAAGSNVIAVGTTSLRA